jgi:hypothetical protein
MRAWAAGRRVVAGEVRLGVPRTSARLMHEAGAYGSAAALIVLLGGCSALRPRFDSHQRIVCQTLASPPSVHATLARKGFHPISAAEARRPTRVWWCVRPVNIPCGRMAAGMGWYHEWILAPGVETGADFYGSDSVRGTWPRSPAAFFRPLVATDHRGAARNPETYCRELTDVQPQAVASAVARTPTAGSLPFPLHNCNTWVRAVQARARQATQLD